MCILRGFLESDVFALYAGPISASHHNRQNPYVRRGNDAPGQPWRVPNRTFPGTWKPASNAGFHTICFSQDSQAPIHVTPRVGQYTPSTDVRPPDSRGGPLKVDVDLVPVPVTVTDQTIWYLDSKKTVSTSLIR